jgi:sentrin-specific protease 8
MTTNTPQNELFLNYNDAVLYESDMVLLDSPTAWLNDACIHFYQTVLAEQQEEEQHRKSSRITFMDPSVVTFLMHQCDEEDLQDFSGSLDKECEMYVISVNDGHASSTAWRRPGGGSHWSLLVILQDSAVYLHFDSVKGGNAVAAQAVATVFSNVLGHKKNNILVTEVNTPQQQNGFDCGLHALGAAEVLVLGASNIRSAKDAELALTNSDLGRPGFALTLRTKIRTKATEFAKDYRGATSAGTTETKIK